MAARSLSRSICWPAMDHLSCLVSLGLLSYSQLLENRDGTLLQDLRVRTSERAVFRQRSHNPCVQALPGQAEERAPHYWGQGRHRSEERRVGKECRTRRER